MDICTPTERTAMIVSSKHSEQLGIRQTDLLRVEVVLRHWSSPHGIGVLTGSRLMFFGHRGPVHLWLDWVADLNHGVSIEVVHLDEIRQYGYAANATFLGGGREGGRYFLGTIEGNFDVRVDGVTVFRGTPSKCEEIQRWIDSTISRHITTERSGSKV